jgi:biopolymer transport protein ExbD
MGGVSGGGGNEIELNLAPIIDCFTVLITYLLVSAAFISVSAFEVGVAAVGQGESSTKPTGPPPYSFSIRLSNQGALALQLSGGAEKLSLKETIESTGKDWDLEKLKRVLTDFKKKYPKLEEVNLNAEAGVIYKDLVRIIESIKPVFAKVFLSS